MQGEALRKPFEAMHRVLQEVLLSVPQLTCIDVSARSGTSLLGSILRMLVQAMQKVLISLHLRC